MLFQCLSDQVVFSTVNKALQCMDFILIKFKFMPFRNVYTRPFSL